MKRKHKTIGIDFDGTIVTNTFPSMGYVKENAKKTINNILASGNEVIIWTCRTDEKDVISFLNKNGIYPTAINENTKALLSDYRNDCRKIAVDMFIDNINIFTTEIDWYKIETELKRLNYITI